MREEFVIALDVGGSSIKSARVTSGPRIAGEVSVHPVDSRANADEILKTFATVITGYLERFGEARGIAMAFPGPFDYARGICLLQGQEKYDAFYGLDVSAHLKKILGLPGLSIRYRNDAEAAILGEARYGAGARFSRLLGLALGTGLGSAFVVDGVPLTGGAGVPEHGWLYAQPYGTQRADDVFSTRGLLVRLRRHGIRAADVASAMADRQARAGAEAFAAFGSDLAAFLTPFVSSFRADGVLVTGGIAEAWDGFAPSLRRSLPVPAVKGTLGKRAPLLGAAALYF